MAAATLGDLLRQFRTAAGLTQGGLAEKAGLSEQAVSLLERGTRRRPRIATVHALAEALGLDAAAEEQLTQAARGTPGRQIATEPPAPDAVTVVPRQLPPTLADFTGRTAELEALTRILTADDVVGTVRMAAVTGMGGVGKTSLAVHAAHLTADAYPDGHLYLDLRGYGPGEPVQPAEALSQLLRSLGIDGHSVPDGVDEAAALYRSRIAGLRMLVLLDNANGAAQVRPLLPGASGSAVIVTSRRGLTALPGFLQLSLSPLSEADSITLLGRIAGNDRVAAEANAARRIARLTGRLPLAVRLIGARLAARPGWPVEHVMNQLQDEQRRLDELGTGKSGVRSNIAASVEFLAASDDPLDRRAAAALDLLGLPNGADLITLTTAHLLDESEHNTEQMLERLVDLNLLISLAPGRYRLHDLIRAYARERADQALSEGARTDALARVLTLYTGIAWRCHRLTHNESRRLTLAGSSVRNAPDFPDAVSALRWLDDERSSLAEAFQQACRTPALRPLVPELPLALFGYYEPLGRWSEMRAAYAAGREIAGELGYGQLMAWLEHDLAIPDAEVGNFRAALSHLEASLDLFRTIGDLPGQARACTSLSRVLEQLGQVDEAVTRGEEALSLSQEIGDETIEGISYLALGNLYLRRGDTVRAGRSFNRAIALSHASGNLRSTAKRYHVAGQAYQQAGLHQQAIEFHAKGIEVYSAIGDVNSRAESYKDLAAIHLQLGEARTAKAHAETGIRLARGHGNVPREGELLIELGRIAQATGDLEAARTHWQLAATLLHSQSSRDESIALALLAETE
ncbi:transcriptional regulator, XRE family [Kribbella flavida DSM 17836]|uniref:Transcriptional regulator, XRE family n=1 Tax=Kribbella flavida (strain DSM 17836 / JCM 10339 / NBRC 14399) TaxID=479435 RepID=D2Q4X4_KRIFD|nr:tetratricopeptide repeat protein [Kribbella flavida]ADB34229.1 transcriptional regulator, XRE family [Kribbella flavida DSM 17836]